MGPIPQSATPNAGDPGDRFTVTIRGDVLSNVTEVSFGRGIEILKLTVVDDGEIRVKIEIADDAPAGPRDIVVTDPAGSTVLAGGFTVR